MCEQILCDFILPETVHFLLIIKFIIQLGRLFPQRLQTVSCFDVDGNLCMAASVRSQPSITNTRGWLSFPSPFSMLSHQGALTVRSVPSMCLTSKHKFTVRLLSVWTQLVCVWATV